ncbi:sulfotransferase [Pseudoxanthomonas sp.]|uniref:tetratricopeptide repeat-containing sulfotransferase family protein n=1 Tax=Pseudoxanthomonas sp. TaxID=1871049 RepID=UPI002609C236|nr:sulfotransferase [Pseudoxanthomonas sp.]WDS36162.1 MAG: sulfotransferase [Pseudoxanthomonas sp.]
MGVTTFLQQAQAAVTRQDWGHARQLYQAAMALQPDEPGLLLQYSQMESRAGRYTSARDSTLKAALSPGGDPGLALAVASRLRMFNEGPALLIYLQRFLPVQRMPLPLLLGFAAQLSYLNLQERALELLDEAWRADPDYPPTLVSRAQVLIYLGRFDTARTALQHCVRRAPELAQAWWLLAQISAKEEASAQIGAIRRVMAKGHWQARDAAFFQYALHHHLDRLGDHEAAWSALQGACMAMRAQVAYDPAQTHDLFRALMARSPRTTPGAADTRRTPIFIVGLHRSGTTLLEQLLDGHDGVRGIGELYDFTSQLRLATDHHCRGVLDTRVIQLSQEADLGAVGHGYLQGLAWRLGDARHFTDKLPSNLLNVGLICEALPQAKILRMVRDPVETCFSNLREVFSDTNPWSYDPLEMANYHRWSDTLAMHWKLAYPGRVLDVDYAALTRSPERVLREVVAFCGLDYQAGMLDIGRRTRAVATASAVQARQGVRSLEVPKWAPYQHHLAPMIEILQREMPGMAL